jgi:hypothetical protein
LQLCPCLASTNSHYTMPLMGFRSGPRRGGYPRQAVTASTCGCWCCCCDCAVVALTGRSVGTSLPRPAKAKRSAKKQKAASVESQSRANCSCTCTERTNADGATATGCTATVEMTTGWACSVRAKHDGPGAQHRAGPPVMTCIRRPQFNPSVKVPAMEKICKEPFKRFCRH